MQATVPSSEGEQGGYDSEALQQQPDGGSGDHSEQLQAQAGDEGVVLVLPNGRVCQGSIAQALKQTALQKHAAAMRSGKSKRGQAWAAAYDCCYGPAAAALKNISPRFKVRAWGNSLPTYAHEWTKVTSEGPNIYKHMYGECGEFNGTCKCCDQEAVDDMNHIFVECRHPEVARARDEQTAAVMGVWRELGLEREWKYLDWTVHNPGEYEGWQAWWGRLGRVPQAGVDAMCQLAPRQRMAIQAAASEVARVSLRGAEKVWAARNAAAQEWEGAAGITARKKHQAKEAWYKSHKAAQVGRGVRTGKAWEDLTEQTRRHKQSMQHKAAALRQYGEEEGRVRHLRWLRDRRRREKVPDLGAQASLVGWLAGLSREERAAWSAPLTHVGMPETMVSWKNGHWEAFSGPSPRDRLDGTCSYGSCMQPGTRRAWGCQSDGGYLRCDSCSRHSCQGSLSGCQCDAPVGEQRAKRVVRPRMTRATEQKRIDAMVDQFHKWQRRERGTPVRVWVHAEHGEARVVGTVVHATQRNADRRKAWGRAVTDPGHPWHPVDEVYIQVGEEEVSVKLHDTTWP